MKTKSLIKSIKKINTNIDDIGSTLNELDGKIGDGDLGVTLINGFKNLDGISKDLDNLDWGKALMKCAQAFTKVSGSSFGTLTAIGLIAASKKLSDVKELNSSLLSCALDEAVKSMSERGKAKLNDKTVLDMLHGLSEHFKKKKDTGNFLSGALETSQKILKEFKQKECKVGRARIFAKKTIGMDDPGMLAIHKLLDCINN